MRAIHFRLGPSGMRDDTSPFGWNELSAQLIDCCAQDLKNNALICACRELGNARDDDGGTVLMAVIVEGRGALLTAVCTEPDTEGFLRASPACSCPHDRLTTVCDYPQPCHLHLRTMGKGRLSGRRVSAFCHLWTRISDCLSFFSEVRTFTCI